MKIMTILGTRPELIRLSRIIPKLDEFCDHFFVHTGQNYSANLKDVFFEELGIRQPDMYMDAVGQSTMATVGSILTQTEALLKEHQPDKVLILGDTNSGLSAFVAKRMGIPVYHMEAGNRCFDDEVPEEVNRPVIDKCSSILMPYTQHSRRYLLKEGYEGKNIIVTGNPIVEVLAHYNNQINASTVVEKLNLTAQNYMLCSLHREENIDYKDRLKGFMEAFETLASEYNMPVVISVHPRLKARLEEFDITPECDDIKMIDALGFFDFNQLQKQACCVLSDSGTVPEECAIHQTPVVLLRTSTERPELVESGLMVVAGRQSDVIFPAVAAALGKTNYDLPQDYKNTDVSGTVVSILLSSHSI